MTKATLMVVTCAVPLWAGTVLASPTPQQLCNDARVTAWKTYVVCVERTVARDARGDRLDEVATFAKCRHAYFRRWTAFQRKASLAGSTCIGGRFTDNGDGTVTDSLSGLVWEKKTSNVTEYPIPTLNSGPGNITVGPDGNLWFTNGSNDGKSGAIGKISPAGAITMYPAPIPFHLATGPDGNLWFTEFNGFKIGKMTLAGLVTEYLLPNAGEAADIDITAGPDGNLWMTGGDNLHPAKIQKVTTAGVFTDYPLPSTRSLPLEITPGPDGNLWFTDNSVVNAVGQITTAGVITEYPLPTPDSIPDGITAGPDGNLWFTEQGANNIGTITTAGVVTEYPIPTANSTPGGITAGPDGNLWFTEVFGSKIGKVTTAGVITEYPVPTVNSLVSSITAGPDANLWFTDPAENKIAKIPPDSTNSVHDVGDLYTWSTNLAGDGTAFTQFLTAGLNIPGSAGASGWRVPTLAELQSILLDYPCTGASGGPACACGSDPCIDGTFGLTESDNSQAGSHWSSTPYAPTPFFAWCVFFRNGTVGPTGKWNAFSVRAVRGGL